MGVALAGETHRGTEAQSCRSVARFHGHKSHRIPRSSRGQWWKLASMRLGRWPDNLDRAHGSHGLLCTLHSPPGAT